jgi:hypothetical protein
MAEALKPEHGLHGLETLAICNLERPPLFTLNAQTRWTDKGIEAPIDGSEGWETAPDSYLSSWG